MELALSHDLIQHEKMIDGLRSLLANLSECHEALLRHLDVMTKHHSECLDFLDWGSQDGNDIDIGNDIRNDSCNGTSTASSITFTLDGSFASFEKAAGLTSIMNEVMGMLSMELYRKQCLAYSILETVGDGLVVGGRDGGSNERTGAASSLEEEMGWEDLCPQAVAERCSKQWPRGGKAGCVDVKFLEGTLDLLLK